MTPEGWKQEVLSNICRKPISYGIVQTGEHVPNGTPCVRVVDLTKKEVNPHEMITTSIDINQSYQKTILERGELMMALRGVVGLVREVKPNLVGANLTRGVARLSPDTSLVVSNYLLWALRSSQVRADLMGKVGGSALQEIALTSLRKVKVPIPPLPEQRKIAKILSTWDKAITTTEKLIATSKQQKKALMQQLLTGKKRLVNPETGRVFEGKWEEVRLESVLSKFTNGYAFTASNYKKTGIPIITMGNIGLDGAFNQRESKANYWPEMIELERFEVRKGDLLIAMTDVTPDKNLIGRMTIVNVDSKFYLNQRVGRLSLDKRVDSNFLRYLSNDVLWRKYSIAVSASGVQTNMSTKDIKTGKLLLPSIEEQQKIAQALTVADKEIEHLESKLAHFQQEKKALMQQLLTGKRRVKIEDTEAA